MLNKSITPTLVRAVTSAFIVFLAFYSQSVFAMQVSIATMITNLSASIPNLMQLVTAIGYVLGMFFVIKGVIGLKEYGENKSQRGGEHHGIKHAIILILIGTALIYLPSSVRVGLSSFWSNPTPYAYYQDVNDSWAELINSVFMIVQLIGTIAFIRGLIMLTRGAQGQHQGGFGKSMTHMVGGILCINMYQFLQAVFNTLGLGSI